MTKETWNIGDKVFIIDHKDGSKTNARVVQVNSPKEQVKLRYIGWKPKPDEWFNMSDSCLNRSKSGEKAANSNQKEFTVGQHVLGIWSDGIWYPGIIAEVRPTGSVFVHFYDGLKKSLRPSHVKPVSAADYQKRLAEVIKTAEEMERTAIEAKTLTFGRTRRRDQALKKTETDTPSTSNQISNESSDVDDTPLSSLVGKRTRRSPKENEVTPPVKSTRKLRTSSRSTPETSTSATRRSTPENKQIQSSNDKVTLPEKKMDRTPEVFIIVNCICGKNNQQEGMLHCSLCQTWQHARCQQSDIKELPYICHFCRHPTNAYSDLPQHLKSKVLQKGLVSHFSSTKTTEHKLPQLLIQAEAVVAMLRKSRQLLNSCDSQNSEMTDAINDIHSRAETLLNRIENATESKFSLIISIFTPIYRNSFFFSFSFIAEAARLEGDHSSLDEFQRERMNQVSITDILHDVEVLNGVIKRTERRIASVRNDKTTT